MKKKRKLKKKWFFWNKKDEGQSVADFPINLSRAFIKFIGFILFVFGGILIIMSFFGVSVTGHVVSDANSDVVSILGLALEVVGIIFMAIKLNN